MQKSRFPDRPSPSASSPADDPAAERPQTRHQSGVGDTTPTGTAVRLTRKYADMIDGVDLTDAKVGDELTLSPHDADVLIAEGWAEHAPQHPAERQAANVRCVATDTPQPDKRRKKKKK